MQISFHSTALFVSDIRRSLEFYTNILGLAVRMDMGTNVILEHGITLWQVNSSHVIARALGAVNLSEGSRFELYFETGDIEAVVSSLKEGGVRFLHAIHEEPWGQRTLRVFDPDGHLIEIGESMKVFLGRMRSTGMSVDEIAARTGMKSDDVRENLE